MNQTVTEEKEHTEDVEDDSSQSIWANFAGLLNAYYRLLKIELKEEVDATTQKVKRKIRYQSSRTLVNLRWVLFRILTLVVVSLVLLVLFGVAVTFLNIGIVTYLNYVTKSPYLGYFLLSGIYLILFALIYVFRLELTNSIYNAIKRGFYQRKKAIRIEHSKEKKLNLNTSGHKLETRENQIDGGSGQIQESH